MRAHKTALAAAALSALVGCTGGPTQEQDQLRSDLARLSSRLRRMESENRKLSEKIDELDRILRKRARLPAPLIPPAEVKVKAKAKERRKPVEEAPAAPKGPRELTGDEFTRKVQRALKKAGLDPGPMDGKMGPRTTEALKEFQCDNNLPETGTANEATWELLKRYLPDR